MKTKVNSFNVHNKTLLKCYTDIHMYNMKTLVSITEQLFLKVFIKFKILTKT